MTDVEKLEVELTRAQAELRRHQAHSSLWQRIVGALMRRLHLLP
jgi:hypothetical protein